MKRKSICFFSIILSFVLFSLVVLPSCNKENGSNDDNVIVFSNPAESQRIIGSYSPSVTVRPLIEFDHYMLGMHENPELHIAYTNISNVSIKLEIGIICYWNKDRLVQTSWQHDVRGIIPSGKGEILIYQPLVESSARITDYVVEVHELLQEQLPHASFGSQVGPKEVVLIGEVPVKNETYTQKTDLTNALMELKQAILAKIDSDIDVTATAFTDVKDYWKAKRIADIFRVPLRTIETTLNLAAKAKDFATLLGTVNATLDTSEGVYQILNIVLILQDLKETYGKLSYGLYGPSYSSSIETMLDDADATYIPPLDKNWREKYKNAITNSLWGTSENTPISIPLKSSSVARKNTKTVAGALEVRKDITRTFDALISEIEGRELPPQFDVNTVVYQIKSLRQEVVKSRSWQTDSFEYETYLRDGDKFIHQNVQTSLGAVGSLYTLFGEVAGNLDKQLEIEMRIEKEKAAGAAGSAFLFYSGTYRLTGFPDIIKTSQKVFVLDKVIIKDTNKVFKVNAEEEFNMLPQEMIMSLPIELSTVWMITNDIDQYLRYSLTGFRK